METLEQVLAKLTGQQIWALVLKIWAALGGKDGGAGNVARLLAGKIRLVVEEVEPLFDRNGRRIPSQGLMPAVANPSKSFRLVQPEQIDFAARLASVAAVLNGGKEFIAAADFEARIEAIKTRLLADKATINILRGIGLPFALPQRRIAEIFYGTDLNNIYLPAVGVAYNQQFLGRNWCNHLQGALAGQVTVETLSRHWKFLGALAKGPVVGVFYPCLQGFSISAALEQMEGLPPYFLLAGGIDTAGVATMWPDVVARDKNTPGLDCAALKWRGNSLYFGAGDDKSGFYSRGLNMAEGHGGGLVVLG